MVGELRTLVWIATLTVAALSHGQTGIASETNHVALVVTRQCLADHFVTEALEREHISFFCIYDQGMMSIEVRHEDYAKAMDAMLRSPGFADMYLAYLDDLDSLHGRRRFQSALVPEGLGARPMSTAAKASYWPLISVLEADSQYLRERLSWAGIGGGAIGSHHMLFLQVSTEDYERAMQVILSTRVLRRLYKSYLGNLLPRRDSIVAMQPDDGSLRRLIRLVTGT